MNLDQFVEVALRSVAPTVRERFARDPFGSLADDFGFEVRAAEHLAESRADGGFCDGVSYLADGVILYRPTPGNRRQNFTVAHELGHVLVNGSDAILDWLGDHAPDGHLLETICDRIAQALLLPSRAAADLVGKRAVAARHIVQLYDVTQASRPVCMVALARVMPGLGAIALLDRDAGAVVGAAVNPDPDLGWPRVYPWRGQRLAQGHSLLELHAGSALTRRTTWRNSWGAQADFYVNAVNDGSQVICVFAETDIWTPNSEAPLVSRDFDQRPWVRGYCCDREFETRGYPCPNCGQPFCPRCKNCRCDRDNRDDLQCVECFLLFKPNLIENGLCESCRASIYARPVYLDYWVRASVQRIKAIGTGVTAMAKNTGKGYRVGEVKNRSEFQHGNTWFKRDTTTGRITDGSPNQHKGVRNEK